MSIEIVENGQRTMYPGVCFENEARRMAKAEGARLIGHHIRFNADSGTTHLVVMIQHPHRASIELTLRI